MSQVLVDEYSDLPNNDQMLVNQNCELPPSHESKIPLQRSRRNFPMPYALDEELSHQVQNTYETPRVSIYKWIFLFLFGNIILSWTRFNFL